MASTVPVTGTAPITFLDPQTGKQYSIPLALLSFPAAGGPVSLNAPPGSPPVLATPAAAVSDFLTTLVTQGLLTPGTPLPTFAGFTITATDAGPAGNFISVTFARPTPGPSGPTDPASTVDITVSVVQVFAGIQLNDTSVTTALGTGPSGAETPGLVFVSGTPAIGTVPPQPGTVPPTSSPLEWKVLALGQTSLTTPAPTPLFVLTPRGPLTGSPATAAGNPDAALTTVQVQNVVAAGVTTFTLIVSWTKMVPAVPLTVLAAGAGLPAGTSVPANPFAYVISFAASPDFSLTPAPPSTNAPVALPRAGTLTLSIQAGAAPGAAATAIPLTG